MPIEFKVFKKENYFISTWSGKVTDTEAIKKFKEFYNGPEYAPSMHELSDLSQFDFSSISSEGLINMAKANQIMLEEQNVTNMKTAVYSPHDLQFGMARIYEAWSADSPETIQIFRDLHAAEAWLTNKKEN